MSSFHVGFADVLRVSPFIILFLSSLVPITIKVLRGNQEQSPQATLAQAIGGVLAATILLLTISKALVNTDSPTAFSNTLVFDGVTMWLGLVALISCATSLLLMFDNPETNGDQFSEITFLTLNAAVGMLIVVSAIDLIIAFLGIEIMSLSLYLLIAMSHEQKISKEAAFKYFVLGGFASALFLYGIAYIFGSSGSTLIPEIMQKSELLMGSSPIFTMGVLFVLVGLAFKVSLVPFHAWTPDVYQGSPTPVTAFMSTAVKAVVFALFMRFLVTEVLNLRPNLYHFMEWIAVITMIVGNTAALLQNNFKRMLAYSSIAHSGYIMVGIIATGLTKDVTSPASSVVFYLFAYSLMTMGAFAVVNLMEKKAGDSIAIDDISGYSVRHPVLSFCLAIFLLSLAGVPPTLGFFGKFYLFNIAIREGLIWLTFWGVLNSVISAYYYLRPIVVMYMRESHNEFIQYEMSATKMAVFVMGILVFFLGLLSGPIFVAMERAL